MINLAFMRTNRTNPVQVAVARGGDWWHTGMVFSDGLWFTSRPGTGVCFDRLGSVGEYDLVPLPAVDAKQEGKVLSWCKQHLGEPYDWRGLMLDKPTPGHWFCAEACSTPLQLYAGMFAGVDLTQVHSTALHDLVMA